MTSSRPRIQQRVHHSRLPRISRIRNDVDLVLRIPRLAATELEAYILSVSVVVTFNTSYFPPGIAPTLRIAPIADGGVRLAMEHKDRCRGPMWTARRGGALVVLRCAGAAAKSGDILEVLDLCCVNGGSERDPARCVGARCRGGVWSSCARSGSHRGWCVAVDSIRAWCAGSSVRDSRRGRRTGLKKGMLFGFWSMLFIEIVALDLWVGGSEREKKSNGEKGVELHRSSMDVR